jgi:hypothetical protein
MNAAALLIVAAATAGQHPTASAALDFAAENLGAPAAVLADAWKALARLTLAWDGLTGEAARKTLADASDLA